MATKITKAPTQAPKDVRLARSTEHDGASVKATWGIPAEATWETNESKWVTIDTYWTFKASKNMASNDVEQRGDAHVMADHILVRDKGMHSTVTVYYDRSKYHPRTPGRYLNSVLCDVHALNTCGRVVAGSSMAFKTPRVPTVKVESFDEETSRITFKVTTDEGKDAYERYDTMVRLSRADSANRGNGYAKGVVIRNEYSTTLTEHTISHDPDGAFSILPGEWIMIRCRAYARGLAGNSAYATADYYYAYPARPTISHILCDSTDADGVVNVFFKMNVTKTAPVDRAVLQRLADTPLATANATASADGWVDVNGAEDNGNGRGFIDYVANARPQARNHTWYRVMTEHGSLRRYSAPVEVTQLYCAYDEGTSISFQNISTGDDGKSVRMMMVWDTDNYTSTEVAWSDYQLAWQSNKGPESYVFDWKDSPSKVAGKNTATFVLRGLDPEKPVYIRARRFSDVNGVVSYSAWSNLPSQYWPISPVEPPMEVTLSAPEAVRRGDGIKLTWTAEGDAEQTQWQVMRVTGNATKPVGVASGKGPAGAATIPGGYVYDLSSVTLYVSVNCGGTTWTKSNNVTVLVRDEPEFEALLPTVIERQPLVLFLACSSPDATVVAALLAAESVSGETPSGQRTQAANDAVWSFEWEPSWQKTTWGATDWYERVSDGGSVPSRDPDEVCYVATHECPIGLDLVDGSSYRLVATASDSGISSKSEDVAAVEWGHQAVAPAESSTVVPNHRALSADITPSSPDGASGTDVCDVWRVTSDGASLIAADVPFGMTVRDRYAPYSNDPGADLCYRLVTRTADGDVEWRDVAYELKGSALRFDWDNKSLELPYNVAASDAREKEFTLERRWDGSRVGYWDAGSTRKSSYESDLVRLDSWDERRLVAELGSWAGPCLVRTPTGQCFCANVEVTSYGDSCDSSTAPVSIEATEHDMTNEFRATLPDDGEVI